MDSRQASSQLNSIKQLRNKFKHDWRANYTNNQLIRKNSHRKMKNAQGTPDRAYQHSVMSKHTKIHSTDLPRDYQLVDDSKNLNNLKHMLVNLARKKKKPKPVINITTQQSDENKEPKIDDFKYLSEEYSHVITPMKLYVQLPRFIPERYLQIISDKSSKVVYDEILGLIKQNRYDNAVIKADLQVSYLQGMKEKIKIEQDLPVAMYKLGLLNNFITLFRGLKAGCLVKMFKNKQALDTFKECMSIAKDNLSYFNDSRLITS